MTAAKKAPTKKARSTSAPSSKSSGKRTSKRVDPSGKPAPKSRSAARKPAAPARAGKETPSTKESPGATKEAHPEVQASPQGWVEVPILPPPPAPAGPSAALHRPAPKSFDPATGDWIAVADPGPQSPAAAPTPADAPDAPKKGTTSYILWTILLWIDLGLLALNFIAVLVAGAILLFAPSSSAADSVREAMQGETNLYLEVLIAFVGFGLIPLLWVLGTRRVPIEGTKRFLHLHDPGKGILRGVLLTLPILLAVALFIIVFTVVTEGVEGLTQSDPDANPAMQKILENLTWPLVILIALGAGIGEEIFFRGLLQRYLGVWGQGILFGLAHSAGGYIPQIAVAFGIGILFGYLVKRGWSLWTMITAHVLYDFTLLSMALLFPEAA